MKKILVVDDEQSLRDTLTIFLQNAGYAVATASDFDSAILQLSSNRFDLVVTDILLGGRTGIDLLNEIRLRKAICPVIMITGYPSLDTALNSVRLGAFDYIAKPVRKEDILRVVDQALRAQPTSSTASPA